VRLVRLPAEGQVLVRGSIIDNTERRRREKIQQATYRISEAVHAVDDLASLYRRIHEIITSLMPARNFYIALLDAATEMISFPYYVDEHGGHPEPFKLNIGLTGYVLRSGRSLLLDAAMNARKKRVGDAVTFEGHEEIRYVETGRPAAIWLGVPLSIGGRPFGAMAMQDYHDERAYGEAEKQVLEFIATQTALAIERKRSEQALRENEQKFRALFEATSQGVMIHDEEKFIEVNPALLRVMGFDSAADIIGKHPRDTAPPFQPGGESSAVLAAKHIAECMTNGSARFDWVSFNGRGEEVPFEVILTRIEMGGRQLIQAVVNDISERKRAEAELLRALAREKELSQLKCNFVSLVSHEFRTPLGIISSSAEILRDYLTDLPEQERRDHLDTIARNTRRMSDLMEEVLVLGRLDAGKMAFEPAPIELAALCRKLVDEVQSATNHTSSLTLVMDSIPAEARADERLLRHILTNLLVNAVKYSEPGGAVKFHITRTGDVAVFTIRDRGIGIPPVDQARLFNSFQRGANVGQRPGSGLGLVIVKRCVDLHAGNIRLESAVGEGTAVMVQIPLFKVPDRKGD
jgi:PAS domain S-box-containing protein